MSPFPKWSRWVRKSIAVCLLGIAAGLTIHLLLPSIPLNIVNFLSAHRSATQSILSIASPPVEKDALINQNNSTSPKISTKDSSHAMQYGHFAYEEANASDLMVVSSFGLRENKRFERLHANAAFALMQMTNAARDEGVWIILVSAFREYNEQSELFSYQIQKRGTPEEAAKASAPPGYSEHHTGYAMDLADGHVPSSDINQSFANTEAFLWLRQHGGEYGFELSFPLNNTQGVNYEPWHWRFTGSLEAQAVFNQTNSSR